ncbi:hypothetical protein D3C84_1119580 [compost metagenome]
MAIEVILAGQGIPVGRRHERPGQEDTCIAQLQLVGIRIEIVRTVDRAILGIGVVQQAVWRGHDFLRRARSRR